MTPGQIRKWIQKTDERELQIVRFDISLDPTCMRGVVEDTHRIYLDSDGYRYVSSRSRRRYPANSIPQAI